MMYGHKRFALNTMCVLLVICLFISSFSFSVLADEPEITLPGGASSIQEMFEEAVSAAESTPSTLSNNDTSLFLTTIQNDNGDSYNVQMFEYLPGSSSSGNTHTKTMVYSTSPEYVSPRISHSQTNSEWDSSISVYGYITIEYQVNMSPLYPNTDQYLLTHVSGGWEKSDNYVSITYRYVSFTCQFSFEMGQVSWEYPTTNTFSYDTGYDVYVPNDNFSAVVGALSIAYLQHGTSEWALNTRAYCLENDILGGVM